VGSRLQYEAIRAAQDMGGNRQPGTDLLKFPPFEQNGVGGVHAIFRFDRPDGHAYLCAIPPE
jgi:hypothetical protein